MSIIWKKIHQQHFMRYKVLLVLVLAFQVSLFGQEKQVKGTVVDATGSALPGVNVVVKGTQIGTTTDIDGKYILSVENESAVLVFSYVGFLNEEVQVGNQTEINITLSEDILQLNEVVVVGYGTQKKSDLTGAVASVKAEDIQKMPTIGIQSALQGLAAGVQVSQNTGAPGSNVTIRIRGISSITQKDPVWIVDGVPAGPNSVNMSDIESFEILKDASSAAIYGSNGANGVILITTKKGKSGKPVVSLNYYHGVQSVAKTLEVANGPEFGAMYTEVEALRGKKTFTFPDYQTLPSYNYQDMIFRKAQMDNVDFNVSGGNEKSNVYFGIGYINQDGVLKATNYQRINIRLNTGFQVSKWLKVGENLSFTNYKTKGFEEWEYMNEYATPIIGAISVHPYLPPYDSTGNWVPKTVGNSDSPLPSIDLLNKEFKNYDGNGSVYVIIEPLKGLSLESRISGTLSFNDNMEFRPTYRYGSSLGQYRDYPEIIRGSGKTFSYNWQNVITYNTTIANAFNLTVMAGYEVGESENINMSARRQYLLTEAPEMWYFDASTDDTTRSQIIDLHGSGSKSAGYSYFGRMNLDYKGKYLFQFNIRRDYSSRFGPNNRAGNFPGMSLGWKFSEENFIKDNLSFLSFGKLRYAWGKAGINTIRDYAYFPTVSVQSTFSYSMDNTSTLASGAGPDVLVDKSIHWEEVVTQNIGIDLAFLSNRLNVTVDRFNKYNNGMLVATTVPGYAGWTVRDTYQESGGIDARPIVNIGNMSNKGWEFTVGWKSTAGKLSYSVDLNYTYVKNIAEDLGPDSVRVGGTAKGLSGNISRTATGGEIGDFWGFEVDRMFGADDAYTNAKGKLVVYNQPYTIKDNGDTVFAQASAQPGDFKFKDINGDGRVNNNDMKVLGNPFPKHLLGLNLNLQYGWFDLSMFWQGAFGNQIFNATKFYGYNNDGQYNWDANFAKDHYRLTDMEVKDGSDNVIATFPANTSAKYPRLDPSNSNGNFSKISSFYVEDGSYLRLKNIQLGITLPERWTNKIAINQVKFYVGARNLLTFTKYSGMDPEVSQSDPLVSGIDKAAYPQARAIIFGGSLKF
jgi:TonB-dependent starch-binding outer membrane protein SusC